MLVLASWFQKPHKGSPDSGEKEPKTKRIRQKKAGLLVSKTPQGIPGFRGKGAEDQKNPAKKGWPPGFKNPKRDPRIPGKRSRRPKESGKKRLASWFQKPQKGSPDSGEMEPNKKRLASWFQKPQKGSPDSGQKEQKTKRIRQEKAGLLVSKTPQGIPGSGEKEPKTKRIRQKRLASWFQKPNKGSPHPGKRSRRPKGSGKKKAGFKNPKGDPRIQEKRAEDQKDLAKKRLASCFQKSDPPDLGKKS